MTSGPMIFINMVVGDIARTETFFKTLGFEFNPDFSDESTRCLVINEQAFAMLMLEHRFRDFTSKEPVDLNSSAEAIFALSAESREAVDVMVARALANGGSPSAEPQDLGFMYGHSFQDPDGHLWEVVWMDPDAPMGGE